MTRQLGMGLYSVFFGFVGFFLIISCSTEKNPNVDLVDYCIRQCVIDTSDAEICDDQCKCAADKLSSQYSEQDFSALVQNLTQNEAGDSGSMEKLKNSLEYCKNKSE